MIQFRIIELRIRVCLQAYRNSYEINRAFRRCDLNGDFFCSDAVPPETNRRERHSYARATTNFLETQNA